MFNKVCAVCGKEFTTSAPATKFCSSECRDKRAKERRAKYWAENSEFYKSIRRREQKAKRCKICSKWFLDNNKSHIYCSHKCRERAYYLKRYEKDKAKILARNKKYIAKVTLTSPKNTHYTKKEIGIIYTMLEQDATILEIAHKLNRSYKGVYNKVREIRKKLKDINENK